MYLFAVAHDPNAVHPFENGRGFRVQDAPVSAFDAYYQAVGTLPDAGVTDGKPFQLVMLIHYDLLQNDIVDSGSLSLQGFNGIKKRA